MYSSPELVTGRRREEKVGERNEPLPVLWERIEEGMRNENEVKPCFTRAQN